MTNFLNSSQSELYTVKINPTPQKELSYLYRFLRKDFERVNQAILKLKKNPRPRKTKKLAENKYRIRVGKYRVLFKIFDEKKLVIIYRVKHRKEAYQQV